jgi:hypothetical protein
LIQVKPAFFAEIMAMAIRPISCPIAAQRKCRKCTVSVPQTSAVSFPREEALPMACLLALTGGYRDAYTWIVHRALSRSCMTGAIPVILLAIVLLFCQQNLTVAGK